MSQNSCDGSLENDYQFKEGVEEAGILLQKIQDYCGRNIEGEKIRFPRGYIRTADEIRGKFPFMNNHDLKSNLAYTIMLSDVVSWHLKMTDIAGTAKDMLIKLIIFLGGTMIESITKDFLKGNCGKSFKKRTEHLVSNSVITGDLKKELDWVWDTSKNMHLFDLEKKEYKNDYDEASRERCVKAFKGLIKALAEQDISTQT